jgi:hypothetical protein
MTDRDIVDIRWPERLPEPDTAPRRWLDALLCICVYLVCLLLAR